MTRGIPAGFIELDPELARKAIEGYEDALAGEQKKAEALYRQHLYCPRGCGSTMQKQATHPNFSFGDSQWSIPRCVMRCHHCSCTINPFDGMIVQLGQPDIANAGAPVINPED